MKIKNLSLIMAVLLAALCCLSGCANETKTSNEGSESGEIIWYDKGPLLEDDELVLAEVNKYVEPIIGAKVKRIPLAWAEYTEKMRMILASKSQFDICYSASGSNYELNSLNGAYMDIGELLNNHGKKLLEVIPEYAIEASKVNGTLYAIPAYKDYAQEYTLWYRTDLAEKYGFDMDKVKNLEDLEPMFKVIKENENGIYPMRFETRPSPYDMLMFDKIAGGVIGSIDLNGDPDKIINPFETEVAMNCFKTLYRYNKLGYLPPDTGLAGNDTTIEDEFVKINEYLPYLDIQLNETADFQRKVLHLKDNQTMGTANIRGSMISFSKNSKNAEKAMKFLEILNTDEYLRNLVAYGIEGKHWIASGDKAYTLPEGCQAADDTGYSTKPFTQGNKFNLRMIEGTPEDMYEKYIEFNDNATKSPALGFAFDSSKVKTEYTAVSNAYEKYMPSILLGTVDPEEMLPIAMEKLRDAGLDKLLDEMQKQYDEWRKISK